MSFAPALARCAGLFLLLAGTFLGRSEAATESWVGTSGDWDDPLNWSTDIPTALDTAIIDNGGTALLPAGVTGAAAIIIVGSTGTGALNVSGGDLSSAESYIAGGPGGIGVATVSEGTWSATSIFAVGKNGAGTLNLTNDGTVSVDEGAGTLLLATTGGTTGRLNLGTGNLTRAGTLDAAEVKGVTGTSIVTFNHFGENLFDPLLSGNLSVVKSGSGTTVLTGDNTYSGPTTVSDGTLIVDGDQTGLGAVEVLGTLGGSGSLAGFVTARSLGTIAPGNLGGGRLEVAGVAMETNSVFAVDLDGTDPGVEYDRLDVTGAVSLSSTLQVTLSFTPAPGSLYFIITNDLADPVGGSFTGLGQGDAFTVGGSEFRISYSGDVATDSFTGGNDVVLQAVPEPAPLVLGALAAGVLLLRRKRRA